MFIILCYLQTSLFPNFSLTFQDVFLDKQNMQHILKKNITGIVRVCLFVGNWRKRNEKTFVIQRKANFFAIYLVCQKYKAHSKNGSLYLMRTVGQNPGVSELRLNWFKKSSLPTWMEKLAFIHSKEFVSKVNLRQFFISERRKSLFVSFK